MSKQSDFTRLTSSTPVNRSSAMVTSQGVHWEPDVVVQQGRTRSELPLPTKPWPLSVPNMTGHRFGRMVVMGYSGKGHRGASYVVRCDCGAYELRSFKAFRHTTPGLMCFHCRYLERLKRR